MILKNDRNTDLEDVGALLQAVFNYAEAQSEVLDRSLVRVGYGNLVDIAHEAAEKLALLHDDEQDLWDGVVWFERLADFGDDSLAAGLFATDDPDVTTLVVKWLLSFGYVEISYGGKRWTFDTDQLAEWDDADKSFHFCGFHGLTDPTIDSIKRFIDQI